MGPGQAFYGPHGSFGFKPQSNGEPLKGLKQRGSLRQWLCGEREGLLHVWLALAQRDCESVLGHG